MKLINHHLSFYTPDKRTRVRCLDIYNFLHGHPKRVQSFIAYHQKSRKVSPTTARDIGIMLTLLGINKNKTMNELMAIHQLSRNRLIQIFHRLLNLFFRWMNTLA